ncbi:hypothetical protein KQI52_11680 [bacterium]|nr:hypothetical protein [bacterium]
MGESKYYGWNLPYSLIGIGAGIAIGIAAGNVAAGIAVGAGLALFFGLIKRKQS